MISRKSVIQMLLTMMGLIHCIPSPARSQVDLAKQFELSVRPLKNEIFVAEPLRLEIRFRYMGRDNFQGDLTYLARMTLHGIRLTDLYFSALTDYIPPAIGRIYPPGFSAVREEVVLYDHGIASGSEPGFVFSKPGVYEVRIDTQIWQGTRLEDYKMIYIASNKAQVKVKEVPPEERTPLLLWQNEAHAQQFMLGDVNKPETELADLRKLIDNYPQSLYARYALFALAGGLREGIPPSAEAISFYERIAQGTADFQFMDRVLLTLIEHFNEQRQYDKSREYRAKLRQVAHLSPRSQRQMKEIVFLADKRLDQLVTYEFAQPTLVEDVLTAISQRTGVSLSIHPNLKNWRRSSVRQTESLREFMRRLITISKGEWIREGNGYKLVPKPE